MVHPITAGLLVALGALLAAGAALARRRSRSPSDAGTTRPFRLACVLATKAAGIFLVGAVLAMFGSQPAARMGFSGPLLLGLAQAAAVAVLLGLFRPHRSARWLAIGVAAFVAMSTTLEMLPHWLGAARGLWPGPILLVFLMADAAVGLVWWSCLARRNAGTAAVFG